MDWLLVFGSVGIIMLSIVFNFSMLYAFLVAILISLIYFRVKGYRAKELMTIICKGVFESRVVFLLILLMGLVISSWMASGIVPTMIYYGFDFINKGNFLLNCFLIASVSALFMGTALGCFSTIGMVLFCLGQGLGLPTPILLGSIISGCFMADKMSPISSLVNLLIGVSNGDYKKFCRSILKTTLPTFIISGIIFYIIGNRYSNSLEIEKLLNYKEVLGEQYYISPMFFLIPLGMMILSASGVKTIYNLLVSIITSSVIAIFIQKIPFMKYINILLWGFKGESVLDLKDLIKGGGVIPMIEVFLVVLCAVILSSIFIETGLLENIVGTFFKKKVSYFILVVKTIIFSSILTVVTCDQTCAILIPVKFLRGKFSDMNKAGVLVRSISDSGVIIAPLMNWNVNSIVIFTITGVTAFSYAPYAVLCYIAPIVSVIVAYFEDRRERA
ncbi:MAG: Na+/H+ antiporter NhaC family protein [Filifactoraceae bacterium]